MSRLQQRSHRLQRHPLLAPLLPSTSVARRKMLLAVRIFQTGQDLAAYSQVEFHQRPERKDTDQLVMKVA